MGNNIGDRCRETPEDHKGRSQENDCARDIEDGQFGCDSVTRGCHHWLTYASVLAIPPEDWLPRGAWSGFLSALGCLVHVLVRLLLTPPCSANWIDRVFSVPNPENQRQAKVNLQIENQSSSLLQPHFWWCPVSAPTPPPPLPDVPTVATYPIF